MTSNRDSDDDHQLSDRQKSGIGDRGDGSARQRMSESELQERDSGKWQQKRGPILGLQPPFLSRFRRKALRTLIEELSLQILA